MTNNPFYGFFISMHDFKIMHYNLNYINYMEIDPNEYISKTKFWVTFQVLGYFSSNSIFTLFLQLLDKKVLDPNGPYISTFQTI